MGLSKIEVQCTAHNMAYQAVDAIKEHFKDYPATKPDRDALYEALASRWIRENLIAACAREVEEWSSVITMHAHTLHDNHPKILALYKAFDESTADLHADKEELQEELKLNTPLLHRDWATHEMEAWYLRSLAKRYRAREFRKMMAKPIKMDVDMYEASTCLDPAPSDDDGSDDDVTLELELGLGGGGGGGGGGDQRGGGLEVRRRRTTTTTTTSRWPTTCRPSASRVVAR